MIFGLLLLVGGAGVIYFLFPQQASAAVEEAQDAAEDLIMTVTGPMDSPSLDTVFLRWGGEYEVDPLLLKAIAMQESSLNPAAVNKQDNESIGLMQILCRPDGKGGCSNRFNIDGWDTATREKLFSPDFNVKMGAQILAWNIQNFGPVKGIAVYNNWSARNAPDAGPFPNQDYVDRVLRFYNQLRGIS